MSNSPFPKYQFERIEDASGRYTACAIKPEPQESPRSVSDIPEVLSGLQGVFQSRNTHVHDASNTESRKQSQNFGLSGGFQLSASRQMSPRCNPPQGHQVEVSLQTANSPSASQLPKSSPSHRTPQPPSIPSAPKSRDGTSSLTVEAPIYVNAKQFNRILCRRAARERPLQKLKLIRTRKPYLHESRHKHTVSRPRGVGGRFLSRDELEALETSVQERNDKSQAKVSPNEYHVAT